MSGARPRELRWSGYLWNRQEYFVEAPPPLVLFQRGGACVKRTSVMNVFQSAFRVSERSHMVVRGQDKVNSFLFSILVQYRGRRDRVETAEWWHPLCAIQKADSKCVQCGSHNRNTSASLRIRTA